MDRRVIEWADAAIRATETLADRDKYLDGIWEAFTDVPINPETECIEEKFLGFPAGTHREEIWKWFDERYSKGVYYLLYGTDGIDRTAETAKLLHLLNLCFDCESRCCGLNDDGLCKFPLVHGRKPKITEKDGCMESSIEPW